MKKGTDENWFFEFEDDNEDNFKLENRSGSSYLKPIKFKNKNAKNQLDMDHQNAKSKKLHNHKRRKIED
jgi:hypothetical protein